MKRLALALLAAASPAAAQQVTPLFATNDPIRLEIRGPISAIAKGSRDRSVVRPAELVLGAPSERHAIRLSPRGITRLRRETCAFPPLRVEFVQPPPATSLFAGQKRLKLVTHCQQSPGFQQHLLLEYAAYRLYNLITPASFRARLATVDYVEADGRSYASRLGFFIEDKDDVARRNAMRSPPFGDAVAVDRLEPRAAARFALFEYMIGNLDWSMRRGPPGDGCCHNSRLLEGPTALLPVPYDFDFSGLVDAPYAVPPDDIPVASVRTRVYRGYCRHHNEAMAAVADFRSKRDALLAELGRTPGLDERSRRKAHAYLSGFFEDIATDERAADKVLKRCLK